MSCSKVSEPQRQRVRFPVCSSVNPLNVTPHSPLYGHQSPHVWTRGVHPGKGPWDGRKIGRTRHDLECQQTRRDEKGLGGEKYRARESGASKYELPGFLFVD